MLNASGPEDCPMGRADGAVAKVFYNRDMRCESCHTELPEGAAFCFACGAKCSDDTKLVDFEYAAFISYRHLPRDQEVAKRVQKAIETFRMPRGFDVRGDASMRLGKCFRDEDELAAAHSLPDRILDALGKSSALIVICTPDTKDSIWVQREVSAFIEMRGRERVFAVLADGTSTESIPELLREKTVESDGSVGHSSPLAVDMRPEALKKEREETLRLIAAIARCGYDDLKQRDRARRRKRIAIGAIASIAAVAMIVGALIFASNAHRNAQIAESQRLAAESERLFSQGDRYGAIEKALEALPKSEASNDRPYVPEARAALEDALEIKFDENRPWNLCYSVDENCDISSIQACPYEGWFATLDSDVVLNCYEIKTGKRLSTVHLLELIEDVPMEIDYDASNWTMVPAGNRIIVSERDGSCVLGCLDVSTGDVVWVYYDTVSGLSISDDASTLDLFCHLDDVFYVGALSVSNGEWLGTRQFDNPGVPHYSWLFPTSMGNYAKTLFVGFDKLICRYDIVDNTAITLELPNSDYVSSVAHVNNTLIVTSATLLDTDSSSQNYGTGFVTVSALSEDLQLIWSQNSTWSPQVVDSRRGFVGPDQDPEAVDFADVDGPTVAVLAGNSVQLIAVDNGDLLYEESFPFPVVGIDPIGPDGETYAIYITCADGSVWMRLVDELALSGGPIAFYYPGPIDCARVDWYYSKGCFAIARSLDDPSRLFVYQAETRTAKDAVPPESYSLDDLIGLAHEQLDAVAQ